MNWKLGLSRIASLTALLSLLAPTGSIRADDSEALRGAAEWTDEVLFLAGKSGGTATCDSQSAARPEKILDSCCICFHDKRSGFVEEQTRFKNFCDNWLSSSGCPTNGRFAIPLKESTAKQKDFDGLPLSCGKVRVMGMFHGEPEDYWVPFAISKTLASRLRAHEVCYDGKSCLIFNDLEKLPQCARGIRNPDCDFTISGNQNLYLMWRKGGWFRKKTVTDLESSSSKTTLTIPRGGSVTMVHDRCSPTGSRCAWIARFMVLGASNDVNVKSCSWNGKIVQQTCCSEAKTEEFQFDDNEDASWSAPGQKCP